MAASGPAWRTGVKHANAGARHGGSQAGERRRKVGSGSKSQAEWGVGSGEQRRIPERDMASGGGECFRRCGDCRRGRGRAAAARPRRAQGAAASEAGIDRCSL